MLLRAQGCSCFCWMTRGPKHSSQQKPVEIHPLPSATHHWGRSWTVSQLRSSPGSADCKLEENNGQLLKFSLRFIRIIHINSGSCFVTT